MRSLGRGGMIVIPVGRELAVERVGRVVTFLVAPTEASARVLEELDSLVMDTAEHIGYDLNQFVFVDAIFKAVTVLGVDLPEEVADAGKH